MSIREKSIFKKHAFEYEGPDGDIWDIVVVEAEGRKYVQFNKVVKGDDPLDPITMDGEMLLEMADAYRKATSKVSSTFSPHLKAPSIQDHRGLTKSEQIQEQVDKSMANQDHDTQPIQSLSPGQDEFAEFRTGVDVGNQGKVPDTPEDIAIDSKNDDLKQWQKDALSRKNRQRQPKPQSDTSGVKRVGAGELI